MKDQKILAIVYAIMAAVFYAVNIPLSKLLLLHIPAALLAGLLYLGAGIGIAILFLFRLKKMRPEERLTKKDLPYTVGMVFLDIAAPIFLMLGLQNTASSTASLLNNFEIVATTVIAFVLFREAVSGRLWLAIMLVSASSALLSVEDWSSLTFSWGSLLVLLAAVCWGLENNCTRKISDKNTYEIVTVKGICSGVGSLAVGLIIGEEFPPLPYLLPALLLGFVAYGLSIFFYIRAQKHLGAAKTRAYYAIAPFFGAFLSFVIWKEPLSARYLVALALMIAGSVIVTADTLIRDSRQNGHKDIV